MDENKLSIADINVILEPTKWFVASTNEGKIWTLYDDEAKPTWYSATKEKFKLHGAIEYVYDEQYNRGKKDGILEVQTSLKKTLGIE